MPLAVYWLLTQMNTAEQPYDGFAGFSQGMQTYHTLFKILKNFKKEMWLRHPLPSFTFDFSGSRWDQSTFEWTKGRFVEGNVFMSGVETLMYASPHDGVFDSCIRNSKAYENPIFIEHDQGHRPPRSCSINMGFSADFVVR